MSGLFRCRICDGSHPAGGHLFGAFPPFLPIFAGKMPRSYCRSSRPAHLIGRPLDLRGTKCRGFWDKMSGLFSAAGDPLSLPAVVFLFSLLAPCVLLALLTLLARLRTQTEPPPGAVRLALRCAVSAPAAPQLRVALIGAPELPQDLTRHGAPVKTSLCLQVFVALSPASLFRGFAL